MNGGCWSLLHRRGMSCNNRLTSGKLTKKVHMYVETILSPDPAIAATAMNCADWPDEAATAATPPSRAAMRCSNTSWMGEMRGGGN